MLLDLRHFKIIEKTKHFWGMLAAHLHFFKKILQQIHHVFPWKS